MAPTGRGELESKWLLQRWDLPPREGVSLAWEGDSIGSIGFRPTPYPSVIIPSFVNTHVHPDFTHLIPGHSLIEWIKHVVKFRRQEKAHQVTPQEESMVHRGTAAWGSILARPWNVETPPPHQATRVAFHEVLGDMGVPLPPPGLPLSPHSPYALTPRLLEAIWRERKDSLKAIHLAESRDEVAFVQGKPNALEAEVFPLAGRNTFSRPKARTPVEYLESLGCLDSTTLAVHAIFLDERDVEILARRGVSVILCPRSNLYLSRSMAPLPLLREAGVPTALGTDGLGSTPSLSLWEEMRALWFYSRSMGWDLSPQEILAMATHRGAEVLGLEGLRGLEEGREASFLVIRLPGNLHPRELALFVLLQGDLHIEAFYIKGKRVF